MSGGPSHETLRKARLWCARQFAKRYTRNNHASHLASEILMEADKRFSLESFGDEGWCDDVGSDGVSYLNTGDSYTTTITCETSHRSARFRVECYADAVERGERASEE
jgi:hypothetical protein